MLTHARHWLIVPAILALTACSSEPASTDKFPFPPQFVSAVDVPPTVLPAPPKAGSAAEKKEIKAIIARQKAMTQADRDAVMAEDSINPNMMLDPVLGTGLNDVANPELFALMRHAASDAWRIGDTAQDYWKRTRPWVADARVKLYVKSIKRPSYPSGHSTTNHVWAHVLAEIFPQHRQALFARAYEIGQHRYEGGVHFLSDIEAGKKLAAIIFSKMRANPQFQRELQAAREELASPVSMGAVNDRGPIRKGRSARECTTPMPGVSMTMC